MSSTTYGPLVDRRQFMLTAVGSAAGMLLGFPISEGQAETGGDIQLHTLIRIGSDSVITIFAANPELGQGVKTALPMIVAEELDVDWQAIRVEQADWNTGLERQFSGGSLSIRLNFQAMRVAGASARQKLIAAAAEHWRVSADSLKTNFGQVLHEPTHRQVSYGELARRAAAQPIEDPPLKPEKDFRIIGTSLPDVDIAEIVTGRQSYSFDTSVPNMVVAAVARCPHVDGQPESFDASGAHAVAGVMDVFALRNADFGGRVILPNCPNFVSGVVVVAEHTWAALEGVRRLKVEWTSPQHQDDSQTLMATFRTELRDRPSESYEVVRSDGQLAQAKASAKVAIDATYELPFLAHVPMEPMSCTVSVADGNVEIWAPTQNPTMAAEAVAKALNLPQEQIRIHIKRCGGAFGRRYYADFVVDAALVSRRIGRPVKLVWSREDDVRHDYFRPASVQHVQAGVDKHGKLSFWHHRVVSHPREIYLERDGSPAEIANYEFPAAFVPALQYEYRPVTARIPVGQWRAVEHSSNVFVVSSVVDELAHANSVDPLDFWLTLVGEEQFVQVREDFNFDASRLRAVIETAASMSNWTKKLRPNQGRGLAASYNQGAWVAEVIEVTVTGNDLRVDRVHAAIDCGLVVNPSGAENQVHGAIIEGLSAALFGEITVKRGVVQQTNFHSYGLCRMHQVPDIKVQFVGAGGAPRGLGEPPLPPVAPALCNAIFAASGKRLRRLPINKELRLT